jgi:phenylacetic acid degradation protein
MVGMNAVVMDDADIGESSIVGATAFVTSKFTCPPRSLVVGVPARVKRVLSDREIEWKTRGTHEYQQLAVRCHDSLIRTKPLTEIEPGRGRMEIGPFEFKPKEK